MQHPDLFFARNGQRNHYRPHRFLAHLPLESFEDATLVCDSLRDSCCAASRDRFLIDVILHQLCRRLVRGDPNTVKNSYKM